MTTDAWERQAEVKATNARLPSVLAPTLVSFYRKRGCCFFIFPFANFVLLTLAQFIAKIPLLCYAIHFLASCCQKNPRKT